MDYTELLAKYRVPPTLVRKPVVVDEDLIKEFAKGDVVFPYAFPGLIFRFVGGVALDDHPAKLNALRSEYTHITVLSDPLNFPRGRTLYLETPPERTRDVLIRAMLLGFPEIVGTLRESIGVHLVAEPGWREYDPLSVLAQFLYKVEAYRLPNDVFYPTPKGPMAEVRMVLHRRLENPSMFYAFLKKVFQHRRRLLSAMFPGAPNVRVQDADPDTLFEVFESTTK